ncbi:Aste57867_12340 [Aphanomyces stellatus]|uniref:Aste57867_12340 protein n=1 Tax=Aphanomyces stellatus TaxID=120398 RepID=A0A485KVC0_9STRA|nr:hypothetical protein As57867_012294 [Aphanomyces stellatus]VFT89192.1 Aste57867_12340 [Aphanomyces stellatus]
MVKPVAEGVFGEVWIGEFMGDKVAIKKLLPNRATPSDVEKFIAEVKLVANPFALEVLLDGHYLESADVFSFGVILSELDTEILPYSNLRNAAGNPYTDTAIMAKVMSGQMLPSFTANCPGWFASLGRQCLSLKAKDRLTAMKISFTMRSQLQDS